MGEKSEFDPAADAIRVRSIVDVLKKEKENHREAGEYMRLFGDSREGWEIGFSAKNNLIFSSYSKQDDNHHDYHKHCNTYCCYQKYHIAA